MPSAVVADSRHPGRRALRRRPVRRHGGGRPRGTTCRRGGGQALKKSWSGQLGSTTLSYRSDDGTISPSDTEEGDERTPKQKEIGALFAGQTRRHLIDLTAPAAAGTYYIRRVRERECELGIGRDEQLLGIRASRRIGSAGQPGSGAATSQPRRLRRAGRSAAMRPGLRALASVAGLAAALLFGGLATPPASAQNQSPSFGALRDSNCTKASLPVRWGMGA